MVLVYFIPRNCRPPCFLVCIVSLYKSVWNLVCLFIKYCVFLSLFIIKSIFRFIYLDTSDRLMHIEHKFYCRNGEFSNLILFIYYINTKIQYYIYWTYCVSLNSSLLFIFASIIMCVLTLVTLSFLLPLRSKISTLFLRLLGLILKYRLWNVFAWGKNGLSGAENWRQCIAATATTHL